MKDIKNRIAIDPGKVAKFEIVETRIKVRCPGEMFVVAKLSVLPTQKETQQICLCFGWRTSGRERCEGHQLSSVRGARIRTVLGEGGIRQAVEQSVPISWLAQDICDQGNVEVWVDLIKRAHLTFPNERIAGCPLWQGRHSECAHDVRPLMRRREVVGPPFEKPALFPDSAFRRHAAVATVFVRTVQKFVMITSPPTAHADDVWDGIELADCFQDFGHRNSRISVVGILLCLDGEDQARVFEQGHSAVVAGVVRQELHLQASPGWLSRWMPTNLNGPPNFLPAVYSQALPGSSRSRTARPLPSP